ncbi:MAG: TIGR03936 family radical SAM-associated protein [Porcipelethomonas sp.]
MIKIRAVFEKRGRAKYISHLDLNRCMQRTFKRSGIPVWYTEGFNPHIYINFALPLSLGVESSAEIMDFNITEEVPPEEIREKLNDAMPEGLKVTKVYTPETKHTAIGFADFRITFSGDVASEFDEFMKQEHIYTIKKTKKGEKEIDLKPDITIISVGNNGNGTELVLRLPAGNEKNINPSLVTDQFMPRCGEKAEISLVERIAVIGKDSRPFV